MLSDEEERKPTKNKIIIEKTSPISPEEFIMQPKKKTKKVIIRGQPLNKTKRNPAIKKRRLLIIDSDTEKV